MSTRSAMRSVGVFCLECNGGSPLDRKFCTDPNCALWPFRFGNREPAIRKYGKQIFEKQNFKEGGKFASPTEARVLEARYFPKPSYQDAMEGPKQRRSGLPTARRLERDSTHRNATIAGGQHEQSQ